MEFELEFDVTQAYSIGVLLLALCLLTGCSLNRSFIAGDEWSNQSRSERVYIELDTLEAEKSIAVPLLAAVAPKLIDYGIEFVQKEVKREASRYERSYVATVAGDQFYPTRESALPAKPLLRRIAVSRSIIPRGSDEREDAMHLILKVVPSADHFYFRFEPESLKVDFAKAKTRRGDNDVDIEVKLSMTFFWVEDGEARQQSIELPAIMLTGVKQGIEYMSGLADKEKGQVFSAQLKNAASAWIPMPPVSSVDVTTDGSMTTVYGTGTYIIRVVVREYDDFGERVSTVAKFVDEKEQEAVEFFLEKLKITAPGGDEADLSEASDS